MNTYWLLCAVVALGISDQGTPRTDRTWSVWINIATCDTELDRIYSYKIEPDGEEIIRQAMPIKGPIIFQWTELVGDKENTTYTVLDMLAEMSKTTYALEIYGKRTDEVPVMIRIYVSPAGLSPDPIHPAPTRPDTSVPWTDADMKALALWHITAHRWVHRWLFRHFQLLAYHRDARIDMNIRLDAPWCLGEVA